MNGSDPRARRPSISAPRRSLIPLTGVEDLSKRIAVKMHQCAARTPEARKHRDHRDLREDDPQCFGHRSLANSAARLAGVARSASPPATVPACVVVSIRRSKAAHPGRDAGPCRDASDHYRCECGRQNPSGPLQAVCPVVDCGMESGIHRFEDESVGSQWTWSHERCCAAHGDADHRRSAPSAVDAQEL